jgi:hypothetical protein
LKEAFRLYDKEGLGYIPTSILKEILHELDDQLGNAELDGIIAEIDQGELLRTLMNPELALINHLSHLHFFRPHPLDGSGTVDFDE